jgi:hypothetical protein
MPSWQRTPGRGRHTAGIGAIEKEDAVEMIDLMGDDAGGPAEQLPVDGFP